MYTVCCWYPVLTVKLVGGNKYSILFYSILFVPAMEEDFSMAVASIISLPHQREASIEYEPCWTCRQGFWLHRTEMYTFSRVFIQDIFRVSHPSQA
jgi:hypothetical protein